MDLLDFDMIKDHPKPFMGFSDITGYHIALNQLCGMVTFHGPLVDIDPSKGEEFIKTQSEDLKRAVRLLMGQEELHEVSNPPGGMMLMTINDGKATGRLCGGNLTLMTGTLGSRYELDTKDKVLLVEEVKETYYYIEFHLTQLRLCKKLEQARAVLMGEISDTLKPEGPYPSVEEIVRERVGGAGRPAIWGLCAGHGMYNGLLAAERQGGGRRDREGDHGPRSRSSNDPLTGLMPHFPTALAMLMHRHFIPLTVYLYHTWYDSHALEGTHKHTGQVRKDRDTQDPEGLSRPRVHHQRAREGLASARDDDLEGRQGAEEDRACSTRAR